MNRADAFAPMTEYTTDASLVKKMQAGETSHPRMHLVLQRSGHLCREVLFRTLPLDESRWEVDRNDASA